MKRTKLPQPEHIGKHWYVPALPPHYEFDVGPYKTRKGAQEAREGMQETINSPLWRIVIQEWEEEEEEFERE